jgi:3-hydroxybutyryl-CoA dehydrogenase
MKIVIAATDEQWNELINSKSQIDWQRVNNSKDFIQYKNADAYFSLKDNIILPDFVLLGKPIFINSVISTLTELKAPANILRINGWSTFLQRPVWETAGVLEDGIKSNFQKNGIKFKIVSDEPGFISARVIAMIINEAYFAVNEAVSSKAEIDTAMKLGTNYPYGPFEWAGLIGIEHIFDLLQKLNTSDSRYQPAALLINEVKENI